MSRPPTDFERELIHYLAFVTRECDEDEVLIEVLCRKLYKHGLIETRDNLWILEPIEGEDETE